MTWYYHDNGENRGPVALEDLRGLRQSNQINDETLVWTEGMPQWAPFHASDAAALATVTATPVISAGEVGACSECGRMLPKSELLDYEGRSICPACKPLFFQRVREGVHQPNTLRYATVLARFCGVFIDGLLLNCVTLLPMILIYGFSVMLPQGRAAVPTSISLMFMLIQYLVPPLYEIIMLGRFGATLGKMAVKVKVVQEDGTPIGYGRATGRYFAKILSGLTIGIGYLMAIWDPEKRALHDRICHTRVITLKD